MRAAIVVFPGTNRERDAARALARAGATPVMVWHKDTDLPPADLIVLPGGFAFGDYLRTGAIAAHSPVMREVVAAAGRGVLVLGMCNGFQILCEAGLLPGVLMRNTSLKFVCRSVTLEVAATDTPFTRRYTVGQTLDVPVAHGEGNWQGDDATVAALEAGNRIIFRYADARTVNGSLGEIAGSCSVNRRVLGLMPHPENAVDPLTGSTDGAALFQAAVEAA